MHPPISRRAFLLASAGAAAVACSKKSPVIKVGDAKDAAQQLNLLITSGAPDGPAADANVAVFLVGAEQRVGFVLRGVSDFIAPAPGSVNLMLSPDQKHWGPPVAAEVHAGAGATPTYLTATFRFPQPADYWLRATYQGRTADAPVVAIDPASTHIPTPGKPMISTPTPIEGDHRGVDPICTRNPPCQLHRLSLDVALTQQLPIALLFATPALCQTATCGPVLDAVIAASGEGDFAGKLNIVHSEIYTDLTAKDNAPAVKAYHLNSEPVLFLADANGVVVERIDGLFGRAEASAGISRLVSRS